MKTPLSWPQWSKRCLALLLIAGLAVPAVNLVVDPFDLFRLGIVPSGPYTNQRYHHTKTLVEHPGRFNLLLLGTSVMGITPVRAAEVVVPGARAYNAGFFMASASDLRQLVKHLDAKGALPLNALIGIDPYLFAPRPDDLSYEFKFPADVAGESDIEWWSDAVFASSTSQVFTKLIDVAGPVRSVAFDFETGAYSLPKSEQFRLQHPAEHAAKVFKPVAALPSPSEMLPFELDAFVELIGDLQEAGVHVRCFIQPMNMMVMRAQGPLALLRWQALKKRLPVEVLDLSALQEVTNNPALWYDQRHFTPAAAETVMRAALAGFNLKAYPQHVVQQ